MERNTELAAVAPDLRPRVYTASRIRHLKLWRKQRELHTGIVFTSQWIDQLSSFDDEGVEERIKRAGWVMDEQDVRRSDYVLVYAADNEPLRGALVEAGMGIALGKIIVLAGRSLSFGTWKFHPQVRAHCELVLDGLRWIKDHSEGKHPIG